VDLVEFEQLFSLYGFYMAIKAVCARANGGYIHYHGITRIT